MRGLRFDEDELIAVAVFKEDTLRETLDSMENALTILETREDIDMYSLLLSAYGKLHTFTDEEYEKLELEDYLIPEEDEDETEE